MCASSGAVVLVPIFLHASPNAWWLTAAKYWLTGCPTAR